MTTRTFQAGASALALMLSLALAAPAAAETASPAATATVKRIMASPGYKAAVAALDKDHERWVSDIITLTEIPAPSFKEATRAKAYLEMLRAEGLTDLEIDPEGNAMGVRKGTAGGGPVVVVAAHLDTVFPEGTNVKVRREGDRLYAPGVGDDVTGLATLLTVVRAMNAAGIKTKSDIVFMGNVGEEGLGDLRGVRYFFTKGKYKDRTKAFFSLDGGGVDDVTTGGTGSKRYRVTFKGPGGHSYGAFGIVNPMSAMSRAVDNFYLTQVPTKPKTTYSASVVGGGTSVNSIPREVWMEFDMRSEDTGELAKVEKSLLKSIADGVDAENAARSTAVGKITYEAKLVGDRPAGATDPKSDLVQYATAAFGGAGGVKYGIGSSDSNIPMSLGIPAITTSRVAVTDRTHSVDEWVEVTKAPNVQVKAANLVTILAIAGPSK
ncbi:peptidase M20 [Phenylobacterium hankyongense]|uniref:Peptidase M20 n=1 Tax=Phenylobacterium hankyongense TaxID=1813876 RepID=A0A328B148_9CAUL|nr:M20/M25/M40 family metallo-hydrolase [Phenylobacterium hankyongense]RAK60295.1 peptidase M20 [Phenylobacterium hankyongense]